MARGLATKFDGRQLRRARAEALEHGLTIAALAARVGAAKEEILLYEAGQRYPEPPRIKQLAQALGISPLELANPDGREAWTLADVRRFKGYLVSDLSRDLNLSPRTYRRLERDGLIAQHRFGLLAQLCELLEITTAEAEHAISQSRYVQERLQRACDLLRTVVDANTRAGCLDEPSASDSNVQALAALYARPAVTVATLLNHEIREIRLLVRRRAVLKATADFGSTADEQAEARAGMKRQAMRIDRIVSSLPQRLDTFFRCMLPSAHWQALSHLNHVATIVGRPLSPAQLKTSAHTLATMPSHLITSMSQGPAARTTKYEISEEGIQHYANYRGWYDALHPGARDFVRIRDLPASGHLRNVELQRRFAQAQTILLSFDGLLCRLFSANLHSVSDELAQAAHSLQLSPDLHTPTDPVGMLRALVRQGTPSKIRRLDRVLARFETQAAQHAQPLPGVSQFLRTIVQGDWRVAVVTDHATSAVEMFLHHLQPFIDTGQLGVFGRPEDPRMMKPHPHGVALAAKELGAEPSRTILLGESVADFLAAQAAGVHFIGVAATPHRLRLLRKAGAGSTVSSIHSLAEALARLEEPLTRDALSRRL